MDVRVKKIMESAVANKASDIHMSVGMAPRIRVDGELLEVIGMEKITEAEMEGMIFSLMSEDKKKQLIEKRELDFSVQVEENRLRVNAYFRLGKLSASLRIIPMVVPPFHSLNIPDTVLSFAQMKQGFVLITGPTGHGKSTTLAAMLTEIANTKSVHIVTIEDPVEYILTGSRAMVSQRELGDDTNSFAGALRSCLRQDPDVVFVGEMRDLETISSALTVAETGHLVLSTLHTNSASQSIDRIIDVFPEHEKAQVRLQLASVITAIVSQRLVPAVDGGRLPAVEILVANGAVRNSIREAKTHMIDNIIQTGSDVGMMTLEMSLAKWVKLGKIDKKVAMNYSLRPGELESRLRMQI